MAANSCQWQIVRHGDGSGGPADAVQLSVRTTAVAARAESLPLTGSRDVRLWHIQQEVSGTGAAGENLMGGEEVSASRLTGTHRPLVKLPTMADVVVLHGFVSADVRELLLSTLLAASAPPTLGQGPRPFVGQSGLTDGEGPAAAAHVGRVELYASMQWSASQYYMGIWGLETAAAALPATVPYVLLQCAVR